MTIAHLTQREQIILQRFRRIKKQTELKAKFRSALTYEEASKNIKVVAKADGKEQAICRPRKAH